MSLDLFLVELQLKASILPTITVSDKGEASRLETGVEVSSSFVAAQTTPDWGRLERLGVTVWCVKDHQVIVVPVAFTASLSSEHSNVECNVPDCAIFDLNVPSALTAGTVKSWVVFRLNLDASRVNSQSVWTAAHEEGRFKVVRQAEALLLVSSVTSETNGNAGWVGELERSSHSAEAVASAGLWVDDKSVAAVGVHTLNGDLDVSLVVRVAKLPATLLVGGVSRGVAFGFDDAGAFGDGGLAIGSLAVITFCGWRGSDSLRWDSGQPCWGKGSPHVVVIIFPVSIIAIVLKSARIH